MPRVLFIGKGRRHIKMEIDKLSKTEYIKHLVRDRGFMLDEARAAWDQAQKRRKRENGRK